MSRSGFFSLLYHCGVILLWSNHKRLLIAYCTSVVRVSLGAMSTRGDVDIFRTFLYASFGKVEAFAPTEHDIQAEEEEQDSESTLVTF